VSATAVSASNLPSLVERSLPGLPTSGQARFFCGVDRPFGRVEIAEVWNRRGLAPIDDLFLGTTSKAAEWKEKQTGARSSGRLIRLDRQHPLVQQSALKV
jgi:hypothetical protein